MPRPLFLIAVLACQIPAGAAIADPELVLVASSRSPVVNLTVPDARKLFLGSPVLINGQLLRPVRNIADALVSEMFMQKVMFMSTEDYERQIRSRVSRTGGGRPPAYDDMGELIVALQRDPLAVTYMPLSQARARPGLRILGEP